MNGQQQGLGRGQRVLTYSQPSCARLGPLAVVVVQVEHMFHPPVRQQRAVRAEHHRVAAIDAAEPHWKPGGLQHAAHLHTRHRAASKRDAFPVSTDVQFGSGSAAGSSGYPEHNSSCDWSDWTLLNITTLKITQVIPP